MGELGARLRGLAEIPSWDWPDDAVELIARGLRSTDDKDSLRAVELSIHVMEDRLAEVLLDHVEDPALDPELRARCALALGPALEDGDTIGFDELDATMLSAPVFQRVQAVFKQAYHDATAPKLLRRKVLEASVRAHAAWHESAVRASYHSDDEDWRVTAVFCMGFVSGFDEEILDSLETDRAAVRFEAIRAAGLREFVPAGPYVLEVAASGSEPLDMRLEAVAALVHLNPRGTEELLLTLAGAVDSEIAEAASEALEELAVWALHDGDEAGVDPALIDELDQAFGAEFDED